MRETPRLEAPPRQSGSARAKAGQPANRLAAALDLVNAQLYTVENRIREQARAFDPAVEGYVSYVCGLGGKRLRPALALLSGGATGKMSASHVDLAVILELIHVATLVHDDIMDGAELRRDAPTANAKWGNSLSVLLGDCLFAHALKLATGFSDSAVCRRIADAAAEVCSGEIIQTQRRFDLKLAISEYYRIVEMKTAALFSAACELGAFLNGAPPPIISALRDFGARLGTAYQIYDDLLDLAGSEDQSGKTLGTDLRKGKFTLPILLLLQNGELGDTPQLLLGEEAPDFGGLRQILEASGALKQAAATVQRIIDDALASLESVPASRFREGLSAIAKHVTELSAKLV